jgi:hypothetical protein
MLPPRIKWFRHADVSEDSLSALPTLIQYQQLRYSGQGGFEHAVVSEDSRLADFACRSPHCLLRAIPLLLPEALPYQHSVISFDPQSEYLIQ